ncbi:MAG: dihydroxy-acid dehydratase [Acidaminococcus fermentans]|nr:dihydroxy-acid dehydratase [Acidaminococcus fermentans]MCF0139014.1 dihydroxy-acid dehydratase [Acidaminococcus fermentans]MDD7194882.1 dihydroxy-acid dehydratase [Acidaminococcus fermentans]MDY2852317.1 dihydroxy-acid dehydratase [Acidaminococcus fermentans]MDY4147863.1 dihydroxy-acid dehydratase [Acidaminococcus fermentans]
MGANLKEVSFADGPVIHSLDHPKKPEGGIAILYGNLAPKGAVVKKAGVKPSMYQFTGTARVFNYMEDACRAIQAGEIPAGTVIVLRYEGPKGGPGMREQHMVTSLLVGRGMDESCALITDGRFSGSTRGPAIGHISPEAAAGGPIATVQDGDTITIDIPGRKLTLHLSAEEIQKRLAQVQLLRKPATPALQKYAALVTSADRGAILEIPECLK